MYSPTQLNVFLDNCPGALAFYRQKKQDAKVDLDADGEQACQVGIAFHLCAHQAALAKKEGKGRIPAVEAAALVLTKTMPTLWAREGADLCLDFIQHWDFYEELSYETGKAFDRKWRSVEWDSPERRLRLVFDVFGVLKQDDEEYGELTLACGQDYKSGWGASPDDIDGPQGLAYSTALFHLFKDEVDAIELCFIAVRRNGRLYTRRWYLDRDEDVADLVRRQQRLEFYMAAADASDLKPRVGYGCSRCSYTRECDLFQQRLKDARDGRLIGDPVEAAKDLIVLEDRAKDLKEALKAAVRSSGPINIDGKVLAFHESKERELARPGDLIDLWFKSAGDLNDPERAIAACRGLVAALKPGVTAAEKVVKTIAKDLGYRTKKEAAETEMPKLCEEVATSEFGWKDAEG